MHTHAHTPCTHTHTPTHTHTHTHTQSVESPSVSPAIDSKALAQGGRGNSEEWDDSEGEEEGEELGDPVPGRVLYDFNGECSVDDPPGTFVFACKFVYGIALIVSSYS